MPVRPIEVAKFKPDYLAKPVMLTRRALDEMEYILAIEEEFNKEVDKIVSDIVTEFKYTELNMKVKARTYIGIKEAVGSELIEPRNYLTKEVIEIEVNSKTHITYLGKFGSLEDAFKYIIETIYNNYVREKPETIRLPRRKKRGIRIDQETIDSIRLRPRERKPKRNA